MVNFTDQHSNDFPESMRLSKPRSGVPFAFQNQRSGNVLAFVGEVNLTDAYYLRPNVAILAHNRFYVD